MIRQLSPVHLRVLKQADAAVVSHPKPREPRQTSAL